MPLVTGYSSLLASVQNYLARSDIAGDVAGFVQAFESGFYRQPRNRGRWMERSFAEAITGGTIPVPADYLGLKVAYVNGAPSSRLERVALEQVLGRYPRGGWTGTPCWMARDAEVFVFGPEPDAAYQVRGTYWAQPVLLRNAPDDAAAHWLIVNAPDLVLFGSLLEAEPFLKNDNRTAVWERKYAQALKDYRDGQWAEERSQHAQEVLA